MSVLENPRRMYAILRHTTVAAFVVVLWFVIWIGGADWVDWRACAIFTLIAAICEFLPVRLMRIGSLSGDSSFSFLIIWAAAILWGPLGSIVVGVIGMALASMIGWTSSMAYYKFSSQVNARESDPSHLEVVLLMTLYTLANNWLERKDYAPTWVVQLVLFNSCLEGLTAAIASLAYIASGGMLLYDSIEPISLQNFAIPAVIGIVVYFTSTLAGFVLVGAIWEPGNAYRKTITDFLLRCRMMFRQQFHMHMIKYGLLGPFAVILAYLQAEIGCLSLAVVVVPFYATRNAFALTVEQVTLFRDTITTLGTYMQHYHPYTRGHLRRVAEMSERLARELKLPPSVIMLMPDAGMLHDIGKVAVPESILDKVQKLTDEEWERIKEHPVKGAEIISHLEFLDRIVTWVKYHHRWYNGRGYPEDDIREVPIEACIIAVADAFDAMTDDRELSLEWTCDSCGYEPTDGMRPRVCPKCGAEKHRRYRQPLTRDQAIDELRRGSGTQFHPEVVRAFLRIQFNDEIEMQRLTLDQAA